MKGNPRVRRDRTRRNPLPRASSPAGVEARQDRRVATVPKNDKKLHYIKPGSRNPRKVTR